MPDRPATSARPPLRRVLVTGGCGFIGSNLVRYLRTQRPGCHVVNLDALTYSGNPENLADLAGDTGYTFVHGDIRDRALVERLLERCDAVIHAAAETHVDRAIMDSRPFMETNVLGTQTMLDAALHARERGAFAGVFLHVSTDEVYGSLPADRPDLRFTETSPLHPNNPYAASKASSDLLVATCRNTFGLETRVARASNNFGPYQFPEKIIPLFVTNLVQGLKVPLYGDGLHVRDWLHVDDTCEAILAILERGRAGETYNIGGHNERSNLELTRSILAILGKGGEMIRHVADRPGHDRRYATDTAKIERELGWRPTRSAWPAALERTVRWYIDNPGWWQRIRAGAYRDYYRRQYGETV
ncbi:MAG: dTDP-glucose 4,6-dehydratase [Planctomycetes bacterium]|nr:dTDP-glucose 4,6-dehydratase [Planctomycetota bacterium]